MASKALFLTQCYCMSMASLPAVVSRPCFKRMKRAPIEQLSPASASTSMAPQPPKVHLVFILATGLKASHFWLPKLSRREIGHDIPCETPCETLARSLRDSISERIPRLSSGLRTCAAA